MKAVMIIFNQVLSEEVIEFLNKLDIRGFTKFNDLQGRGSENGNPHMGSHSWPALNNAVLTIVKSEQVNPIKEEVKKINTEMEEQGIRLFGWNIDDVF